MSEFFLREKFIIYGLFARFTLSVVKGRQEGKISRSVPFPIHNNGSVSVDLCRLIELERRVCNTYSQPQGLWVQNGRPLHL